MALKKINIGPRLLEGELRSPWWTVALLPQNVDGRHDPRAAMRLPVESLARGFRTLADRVYSRWRLWCAKGVWSQAIRTLARHQQGILRFSDESHLKVHQDANGGFGGKETQAIGHTRGGASSKLRAVVDGKGRLVKAILTAGQVSDAKIGPVLVAGLRGVRILGD